MFASEVKLQNAIESSIKINKKLGEKSGGNQNGGSLNGRYSVTLTEPNDKQIEKTALIKQEINKEKNLIEFVFARLAQAFDEKYAHLFAKIFLIPAKNIPDSTKEQQEDNSPYVASIFVAEDGRAKDLWKYIYKIYLNDPYFENIRKRNGHQSLTMPKTRPRNLGTGEPKVVFDTVLPMLFQKYPVLKVQFAHILAMAYWCGDPDKHMGNIMVRLSPDKKTIEGFSSIDFAGGFDWFDWDQILFPVRAGSKKYGFQPTNHIKEYSRKFRITLEIASVFEQYATVSNETIQTEVMIFISELAKMVPENDFRALATKLFSESESVNAAVDIISRQLTKQLIAKRDEFKKLALEIRLSCYFYPKNRKRPEEGFICEGQNLIKLKNELKKHNDIAYETLNFRSEGQEYHADELRTLVKNLSATDAKLETISPLPFVPRVKYALFDIYHLNPNASFLGRVKVVFGWSDSSVSKVLGFIFKLPYSILKLGIEFLPAIGEQFFCWASDCCLQIQKNPKASTLQIVATGAALCVTNPLSRIFLVTRLLTMRISSPRKSIEQALNAGRAVGELFGSFRIGRFMSATFAFLSIALTLTGWCAIATAACPYVFALSAKLAATSSLGSSIVFYSDLVVHWLAGNVVSQMVSSVISEVIPTARFVAESFTCAALFLGGSIISAIKKYRPPQKESKKLEVYDVNQEVREVDYSSSTKSIFQNGLRPSKQQSMPNKAPSVDLQPRSQDKISTLCKALISTVTPKF